MSSQDNIKLARQVFDAWNAHDPERYVKLLDEKWAVESDTLPATMTGRDAAPIAPSAARCLVRSGGPRTTSPSR